MPLFCEKLEAAHQILMDRLTEIGSCGDGDCKILRKTGQHTNGGCHCYSDRMRMQRYTFAMNRFRGSVESILQDETQH